MVRRFDRSSSLIVNELHRGAGMTAAAQLRQLIGRPGILLVPGAYNPLVARIFEQEGFEAVYVGGHGAAAAGFGLPDIGLVTQAEMAQHVERIANAVSIPLIADADEGYGDITNVVRTVRQFERAGAAAIQLEDQQLPKRCGHMEGKKLIGRDAMVDKLSAAIAARMVDTVIIARTDAIAVTGVADAIQRLQAYAQAGADVLFADAPRSLDELRSIAASVDKPLIVNVSEGGKTPAADLATFREIGIKLVIYPSTALLAAAYSARQVARTLRDRGGTSELLDQMVLLDEFNDLAGLSSWRDTESRFSI